MSKCSKLLGILLLMISGCMSTGNNSQQVQFQQSLKFWSDEVTRLDNAMKTLPEGKERNKIVKELDAAQWWIAFFTPLVTSPTTPTTQPIVNQ